MLNRIFAIFALAAAMMTASLPVMAADCCQPGSGCCDQSCCRR